jgi:hypothetical protein
MSMYAPALSRPMQMQSEKQSPNSDSRIVQALGNLEQYETQRRALYSRATYQYPKTAWYMDCPLYIVNQFREINENWIRFFSKFGTNLAAVSPKFMYLRYVVNILPLISIYFGIRWYV